MNVPLASVVAVLLTVFAGCGSQTSTTSVSDGESTAEGTTERPAEPAVPQPAEFELHSLAFADGQPIPVKYTDDGDDVSPPLSWSGLPEGTKQLALICDDPDAPTAEPWVHWVIYKIPPTLTGLPEGVPKEARPAVVPGAIQGRNGWRESENLGYRGPAPPPGGVHHYFFNLYALDAELDLQEGLDKKGLLAAIEGHVLAEARWMGTYTR